jgi:1-acyl-sn-glycerol-3-phosphate acyltransferase
VSNHSGGTTIPDVWGLMVAWIRRFGEGRVVHPLAHDMVFSVPPVAERFAKLGVLRASPSIGEAVLSEWRRDLFVCPGGDRDTWRPYRDRYKVHFSGRKGYARLALRTGVPVTPIVNSGAHESLVVLTDGRRIARTLHLSQLFRAEIFPIHLSLPWGIGIGPLPHLPWPVHLRYRIGPPVPFPEGYSHGDAPTEDRVAAYDLAVRGALQGLLDELSAEAESLGARLRRMAHLVSRGAGAAVRAG